MKTTLLLTGLLAAQLLCNTPRACADERDERIKQLEKRVESFEDITRRLEEKLATLEGRAAEPRKPQPSLSVGATGFAMQSADTNFVLRLRAILQVDSRSYFDDSGIVGNDGFLLRRVRPIFEGTVFRDFDFRLQPDFAGSSATIRDAYLNYTYNPGLQLRIGKFKTPVGLEQVQSDAAGFFAERSMVSDLLPSRDVGVQLHGELWPGSPADTAQLGWRGVVNYAAGVFNGLGDGRQSSNADFDDDKHLAGRLFLHPFLNTGLKPLKGLGLGIGASTGETHGAAGLPQDNGYATEGQQVFFRYYTSAAAGSPNVAADGRHWRVSPQGYWHWDRFGLQGEYAISSQHLRRTDTGQSLTARNTGWQISGAWMLTGETPTYKFITPKNPFDPHNNSWGAFELVGRYSQLDVDDAVFPLFADPKKSATQATAWGAGMNWYLNSNVRTTLDFIKTRFQGGENGDVSRQDEKVLIARMQLRF